MQNAEIPLIILNSDFFIDVLPVILKVLRILVGIIEQLELLL